MKTKYNSIAPAAQQSERLNDAVKELFKHLFTLLEKITKYLSEQIKSSTPLERLAFACCVYVGLWKVILKIV